MEQQGGRTHSYTCIQCGCKVEQSKNLMSLAWLFFGGNGGEDERASWPLYVSREWLEIKSSKDRDNNGHLYYMLKLTPEDIDRIAQGQAEKVGKENLKEADLFEQMNEVNRKRLEELGPSEDRAGNDPRAARDDALVHVGVHHVDAARDDQQAARDDTTNPSGQDEEERPENGDEPMAANRAGSSLFTVTLPGEVKPRQETQRQKNENPEGACRADEDPPARQEEATANGLDDWMSAKRRIFAQRGLHGEPICIAFTVNAVTNTAAITLDNGRSSRDLYKAGKWLCHNCLEQIPSGAYDSPQVVIGMLGRSQAGKSCLMAALVHHATCRRGELRMPSHLVTGYQEELQRYAKGYAVRKTERQREDCFSTSVLFHNTLWTFVDIPGELFLDGMNEVDVQQLTNEFNSIFECDSYMLCFNPTVEELYGFEGVAHTFFRELAQRDRRPPVALVMTKKDEEIVGADAISVQDSLHKSLQPLYRGFTKEMQEFLGDAGGIETWVDTISHDNYFTLFTCSAYGNLPGTVPEYDKAEKTGEIPSREIRPKNIGTLWMWLEMIGGVEVITEEITRKCTDLKRTELHRRKDECNVIRTLFCNPSNWDKECILAYSRSFPWVALKGIECKVQSGKLER